ncbi:hypothetical protein [Burkholderia vietnamiensis]|uniref:hypothetical protein n=1 Tax=Burkholderia vietnamiensis TaxID=60552 RepID=UPI001B942C0F|nr:hypothetical protein [Burkholderia vietnamiensis]MBR8202456.1 hypothetical protein [Burkholderia vietnamiensis]MCA8395326.1 hypothetical protein [Burkholderia vietnamiensis]HDR8961110.1 hypothetical protein [Burkholderia vietnamiensis]HDR9248140.1 hypothetical protein [Burkholderia vietnamiensis]
MTQLMQLQCLPPEIALQSISRREIVLPLNAAIAAIDYCANNKIRILGWEGWIQSPDGRVGHGNAPQGTTSLEDLSIPEAADFCRRTIAAAALEWTENNLGTTDRLHFCITVEANDAATNS